jgi:GNAT superfamily N-acetyltransferase
MLAGTMSPAVCCPNFIMSSKRNLLVIVNRVIGASVINIEIDSENHLSTGPCITSEYRNRGFGSLLLKESLLLAAKAGCRLIFGVTRTTSPAAKFVYLKYQGRPSPYVPNLDQPGVSHRPSAK